MSLRAYSRSEAGILSGLLSMDDYQDVATTPNPNVLPDHRLGRGTAILQSRLEKLSGSATCESSYYHSIKESLIGAAYKYSKTIFPRKSYHYGFDRVFFSHAGTGTVSTTLEGAEIEAALWSVKFHTYATSGRTRDALDTLFSYVEDAFDVPDFQRLDGMLNQVVPSLLSAEMLISVLRSTSRAKASLPRWNSLLAVAKTKVEQEGLPTRLLRGLQV